METEQTTSLRCVNNGGYPASLEVGKTYLTLSATKKSPAGYARVIDETGEDYLFPARLFVPVEGSDK